MAALLQKDALTGRDTISSTLANIGPAFSIYVSIGIMAGTAGFASIYTVLLAGLSSIVLALTLGAYAKRVSHAGSYVQFIQLTLGRRVGTVAALAIFVGSIFEFGAVSSAVGRFTAITLEKAGLPVLIPYPILSLLIIALILSLIRRGIKMSIAGVIAALAFEVLTLLIYVAMVGSALLTSHTFRMAPFAFNHTAHVWSGIAASFPIVFFLYMGWDNSASLAEETQNARRTVRASAVWGTVLSGILYGLVTMVTLSAQPLQQTATEAFPFANIAVRFMGPLAILIFISSVTSTFGVLIAMLNARSRIIFSAGREGMLARHFAHLTATRAPMTSVYAFAGGGSLLMLFGYFLHVQQIVGLLAGIGTFFFMVVYAITAVMLPRFVARHNEKVHWFKHVAVPYAGALGLLLPLYTTIVPGPSPSLATIAVVASSLVLFTVYAVLRYPTRPGPMPVDAET